jgi:CheY-specific phosphatase CheX
VTETINLLSGLAITPTLITAVLKGTKEGVEMAAMNPTPVGASSLAQSRREISVMVGLVGDSSGTITVNMSKRAMLHISGKMLFEEQEEITEDNVDAICEIGNMIAGCTKEALSGTQFEVENLSLPSMIFGASFDVRCTRGIDTCTIEFSIDELPIAFADDKIFTVTISLLRRIAK